MNTIELALEPITGYLLSIKRNTVNGCYELEIGIPSGWVYDEDNDNITCEETNKSDAGKLIKISPKNEDVIIDDLIDFVEIIIDTNNRIAEKEKQFTDKMQEMKNVLEIEAKKFYKELDDLKEKSFKSTVDVPKPIETKKVPKARKSKVISEPLIITEK